MRRGFVLSVAAVSILLASGEESKADSIQIPAAMTDFASVNISGDSGLSVIQFSGALPGGNGLESLTLDELYAAEEEAREPVDYCIRYPDDCTNNIEDFVDAADGNDSEQSPLEADPFASNYNKTLPIRQKLNEGEKILEQYSEGDCLVDTRSWLSLKDRYNEFTEQAIEDVKKKYGFSNADKCRTVFQGELEFERKEIKGKTMICIKYTKSDNNYPIISVICKD